MVPSQNDGKTLDRQDGLGQPDIGTIRDLLRAAFTAPELRRFCMDRPSFESLLAQISQDADLDKIIDRLIDYCQTRILFDELLTEIKTENPRQFARFRPHTYGAGETSATRASTAPPDNNTFSGIPFTNREDEIDKILSSFAPTYTLLDAPAGYGKTWLLKELEKRFEALGWMCACYPVQENDTLAHLAQILTEKMNIAMEPATSDELTGSYLVQAIKNHFGQVQYAPTSEVSVGPKGVALLIDFDKEPELEMIKPLFDVFIPRIQRGLSVLEFFASKGNRFRVVVAGRHLAGKPEIQSTSLPLNIQRLAPFDYDVVQDTARKYLIGHDGNSITQIAAHMMYLTGGHPGCMAHVLKMYREAGCAPSDFVADYAPKVWNKIVSPVADQTRRGIPHELRASLDNLSIYRHLDYAILGALIQNGNLRVEGIDNEYDLADRLTGTYLLDWKGRLLQDDITRRLLSIRLRHEIGANNFGERCKEAQTIYAEHLQDPSTQMPEVWAIEYLFQFLQGFDAISLPSDKKPAVASAFYGKEVPQVLDMLTMGKRNAHMERNALVQRLATDWEFRFAVNYHLGDRQYDDKPFIKLQKQIDEFFANLLKAEAQSD